MRFKVLSRSRRNKEIVVMGTALGLLTTVISIMSPLATAPASSVTPYTIPNGRLFATNCMQCHGTDGQSGAIDQLAGDNAADLYNKLLDQKTKNTIMGAQARGYSDAELLAIANYFASIPKL